jgi:hypothetical protein
MSIGRNGRAEIGKKDCEEEMPIAPPSDTVQHPMKRRLSVIAPPIAARSRSDSSLFVIEPIRKPRVQWLASCEQPRMAMQLTDEQLDWLAQRVSDAAVSPKGGRPAMDMHKALRGIF